MKNFDTPKNINLKMMKGHTSVNNIIFGDFFDVIKVRNHESDQIS